MATQCPKCNSENPDTQQFCGDCGTRLIPAGDEQPSFTMTLETPVEELTRGTTIAGRYEIIEELGTGGMGKVFRVEDTKIHEEVALKLIRPLLSLKRLSFSEKEGLINYQYAKEMPEKERMDYMEFIAGVTIKGGRSLTF